jgi:putative DNA primase/helicase
VTIPPHERDQNLTQKLKAEWSGILAGMVQGALSWQRDGLRPPEAVKAATAAYLEAEDALTAWMDESCRQEVTAWETSSELFGNWKAWAERSGENPGSIKRFVQQLETRGFTPERRRTGRGFTGIRLGQPSYDS